MRSLSSWGSPSSGEMEVPLGVKVPLGMKVPLGVKVPGEG